MLTLRCIADGTMAITHDPAAAAAAAAMRYVNHLDNLHPSFNPFRDAKKATTWLFIFLRG